MVKENSLYRSAMNPLLVKGQRKLPREVAVIGAGTIGPDIGYYLKSAMPDCKLILVDVVEKPLQQAERPRQVEVARHKVRVVTLVQNPLAIALGVVRLAREDRVVQQTTRLSRIASW